MTFVFTFSQNLKSKLIRSTEKAVGVQMPKSHQKYFVMATFLSLDLVEVVVVSS